MRAYTQWKNGRQIDQYIGAELNKRYKEHKMDPNSVRDISVINLVLQSYLSEPYKFLLLLAKLDLEFRLATIRKIHLFIFTGRYLTGALSATLFFSSLNTQLHLPGYVQSTTKYSDLI